ncbi:MAG: phospholipase D-like domain-containing protein [Candidatus Thermoplasmatota archaeon]
MKKHMDILSTTTLIFILIFLLFILFSNTCDASNSSLLINEVMYHSENSDYYHEWIELYNPTNQTVNISQWTLSDNKETDFIQADMEHGNGTTFIPPKKYAILTDYGTKIYEQFNISKNTIKLKVDDSSIGNGLGNTNDKIILKNKTENIVDAVEWGKNYSDIPGAPINITKPGTTLARFTEKDFNDTSKDFRETTIPTPGDKNRFDKTTVEIIKHPNFIPKTTKEDRFSLPFAFQIKIQNLHPSETYDIKSYIIGKKDNIWPATQTWDGKQWRYSNYYTNTLETSQENNITLWTILRFNREYQGYTEGIQHQRHCFFYFKIKKDDEVINEVYEKISLIEMEKSTINGSQGGYITGIAQKNNTVLENHVVIVEDENKTINSIYFTENNNINEGYISKNGYYKTYSTVGEHRKVKFLDNTGKTVYTIENITVKQGENLVDITTEKTLFEIFDNQKIRTPVEVTNHGDFDDNISLKIIDKPVGWKVYLEKNLVSLKNSTSKTVFLNVKPNIDNTFLTAEVKLQAVSENDPGITSTATVSFKVMTPDLTIKKITAKDENKIEKNVYGCGEIIAIKGFTRNIGTLDAYNVNISFYYDSVDKTGFIGKKYYENIGKYQKYPRVLWDTTRIKPGVHKIYVIVDEENSVEEINENNNMLTTSITLFNTTPDFNESQIVFTEIYYHSHPNLKNEYLTVFNPTKQKIDLSGFYITDEPSKNKEDQNKIIFPDDTYIDPFGKLLIAENAETYLWESNQISDFEYNVDSRDDVSQMENINKMVFSNQGEVIALKNQYNHTVDLVIYGKNQSVSDGWIGYPIPFSGEGVVLKRNLDEKYRPVDTDSYRDWIQNRVYRIGQSDYPVYTNAVNGTVKVFVSPDCSYRVLKQEIQRADSSIRLNVYEFTHIYLYRLLSDALERNVSVDILVEGQPVGGMSLEQKFILQKLSEEGATIHFNMGKSEENIYSRYTFNHAKYLVIDEEKVVVESCNWAVYGVPKNPVYGNREWGVIIKNETLAGFYLNVFNDDFNIDRCDVFSIREMDFGGIEQTSRMDVFSYGKYVPSFSSREIQGCFNVSSFFSPDNSYQAISDFIDSAEKSIYVEQLYIHLNWDEKANPFISKLVNKSRRGVDVKVVLNYNPVYRSSNEKSLLTKQHLEKHGIEVKFVYSNWSYFRNIHNKGVIVDNESVLISSVNWNSNSVLNNREAGLIIRNKTVAKYFSDVFFYDWKIDIDFNKEFLSKQFENSGFIQLKNVEVDAEKNNNTINIIVLFTITFLFVVHDWRKRKWT